MDFKTVIGVCQRKIPRSSFKMCLIQKTVPSPNFFVEFFQICLDLVARICYFYAHISIVDINFQGEFNYDNGTKRSCYYCGLHRLLSYYIGAGPLSAFYHDELGTKVVDVENQLNNPVVRYRAHRQFDTFGYDRGFARIGGQKA